MRAMYQVDMTGAALWKGVALSSDKPMRSRAPLSGDTSKPKQARTTEYADGRGQAGVPLQTDGRGQAGAPLQAGGRTQQRKHPPSHAEGSAELPELFSDRDNYIQPAATAAVPSAIRARDGRESFARPGDIPGFIDFGHIDLASIPNVRDLGGMPASDGRRIARRRLVRAGELGDATASDMRQLCSMHDVDCVIDLRTDVELKRLPDPLPLMHGVQYVHLPAVLETPFTPKSAGRIRAARQIYKASERPFKAIHDLYTHALLGEAGIFAYSQFLHILLEARRGATLWHCTQGKDRTGIAAILVEHILGVPREYIMYDYLATNLFVGRLVDKLRDALGAMRITRHLDADIWALAYANTYYFATVFKTLDQNFGGIDAYIERALDFGPDKQEQLREMYLDHNAAGAGAVAGATGSLRALGAVPKNNNKAEV